ncbi:hypothetical protein [Sulfitobacter aestuariivivens]|uniref:hypothetical protein n=1 Tax=Sulfitobacter aestuariivivens TaxID=2766981 RepID=UPI0036118794
MTHILIIDSDTAEKNAGNLANGDPTTGAGYANALRACQDDVKTTIVAPYDGDEVPPLDGFDGVVFTGSGVAWSTDDARAAPLAAVMRRVFDMGLPTLGSCNGMQLAASVLGAVRRPLPWGARTGWRGK